MCGCFVSVVFCNIALFCHSVYDYFASVAVCNYFVSVVVCDRV